MGKIDLTGSRPLSTKNNGTNKGFTWHNTTYINRHFVTKIIITVLPSHARKNIGLFVAIGIVTRAVHS